MTIGIVGSEQAKFTPATEALARRVVRTLLTRHQADTVVSGGCHLGGVDRYAAEEGRTLGLRVVEHLPAHQAWRGGYRERNLRIAQDSDRVFCITVDALPASYTSMRFPLCYHCHVTTHVKSGGCWTVKQALALGKAGGIYVVSESGAVRKEP